MSLRDWTCDNDKFEPEDGGITRLDFPCCACKHQRKTDADEPCRSCGHNINAEPEPDVPQVEPPPIAQEEAKSP